MNTVKNIKPLFLIALMPALLAICLSGAVLADSNTDRCYLSDIDYADNPNLTREERIAAMNAAFLDSINQFEECMLSTNSSGAGGGAQGGVTGSGGAGSQTLSGTEDSDGEASAGLNSVAAGGVSGTETEPVDAGKVAEILNNNKPPMEDVERIDSSTVARSGPGGSGKAPEDIPEANNDDVIAAQIRLAAEIETDPEKKAKLWNEYRKYKGIPVKE